MRENDGLCHLYYGDGKGKTTAAAGLAVRALGQGMDVVFAQFLKNGQSGELAPLRRLGAQVLGGTPGQKFTFAMDEREKALCAQRQNETLAQCLALTKGRRGCLLVLDEGVDAAEKGFLDKALLQEALARRPGVEIVLTGHSAPAWALEAADYVTLFKNEKHPYQRGVAARKGIEY